MTLVLLETLRNAPDEGKNWLIENPEIVLESRDPQDIPDILDELETRCSKGYLAAGFLTYEAGYSFLPHMPAPRTGILPAIWFALTKNPADGGTLSTPGNSSEVRDFHLNLELPEYEKRIERIRNYIEAGDTYQVNLTTRFRGNLIGSPRSLYHQLRRKQSVSYAAYIETDSWAILSLSPELFFRKQGNDIFMRPMKGTSSRGRTIAEDRARAEALQASEKERSENLMIVDLIRNDLGKICAPGSVQVFEPLYVETYETVLQMTSRVTGKCASQTSLHDVFRATFPSGSITGAPKIRTMQIIHELEDSARQIYTGTIGYISRDEAVFSVAIRTAFVDRSNNLVEMGVGGGILHEADAKREYQECKLKGQFFTDPPLNFSLIETILWEPETGFARLSYHLERLLDSATYFLFSVRKEIVMEKLQSLIPALQHQNSPQRIRFTVEKTGEITISCGVVERMPDLPRVRFASINVDSENRFLYHKTTNRNSYDRELESARKQGYFDVIFKNERGEITEGTITNVFIQKAGRYYTPSVDCGLLNGTFRRYLLESGSIPVEECVMRPEDVLTADAVYLTNSIRGLIQVELDADNR